ncbi:family 2 glycosyl transferase [Calothrix sp. NIES-4071]|nr:family 2 glycosyl transferase [Calothrix sp. NIES-4071]BAZ59432.1 family 2 glycosyl transferase [Calothrix sp. NIES-4105]
MGISMDVKLDFTAEERKILLEEMQILEHNISIFDWGLRGFRTYASAVFTLPLTNFMQTIGYNKKKLVDLNKSDKVILNIGCRDDTNNDYINAELFPSLGEMWRILRGKRRIEYDLFLNICYEDKNLLEVADGIILSHVLEHIPLNLALVALKNCFKYLKKNGCIRICVPYLGRYQQPLNTSYEKAKNMLAVNTIIYCYGHKVMYNVELLKLLMAEVGFSQIEEVNFQEGLLGMSDLPERQPESIYLTGIKI